MCTFPSSYKNPKIHLEFVIMPCFLQKLDCNHLLNKILRNHFRKYCVTSSVPVSHSLKRNNMGNLLSYIVGFEVQVPVMKNHYMNGNIFRNKLRNDEWWEFKVKQKLNSDGKVALKGTATPIANYWFPVLYYQWPDAEHAIKEVFPQCSKVVQLPEIPSTEVEWIDPMIVNVCFVLKSKKGSRWAQKQLSALGYEQKKERHYKIKTGALRGDDCIKGIISLADNYERGISLEDCLTIINQEFGPGAVQHMIHCINVKDWCEKAEFQF